MPSKGQRAASRQAKLSKRKRKSKPGGNQVFHAEPIIHTSSESNDVEDGSTVIKDLDNNPDPKSSQPTKYNTRKFNKTGGTDVVPHYEYLSSELLRISIVSGIVVLVLVVLTFVLGD